MEVRKSGVVARAGALEAEVDKVLPCLAGLAEEDLAAFVQHDSLVEEIIGALGSLVDGDARGAAEQLRLQPQRAAELDRVGAVETSGAVVPALERGAGERRLGDGNTLPLATRDTADVLVADRVLMVWLMPNMAITTSRRCVAKILRRTGRSIRGTGARGEGEGVAHDQLGKVHIHLGGQDSLATVVGVHLLGGHALVVEVRLVVHEDAVVVASDGLEQGAAARTRGPSTTSISPCLTTPSKSRRMSMRRLPTPKRRRAVPRTSSQHVDDVLLVVGSGSEAEHVEVLERNTGGSELASSLRDHVHDGLRPRPAAEFGSIRVQGESSSEAASKMLMPWGTVAVDWLVILRARAWTRLSRRASSMASCSAASASLTVSVSPPGVVSL